MSADFTTWLARTLRLPLFEETVRGGVRANSAARNRLGDVRLAGLADAIARCCGEPGPSNDLVEACDRARAGDAQDVTVAGRFRVAITPVAKGRAAAVVAPLAPDHRLEERAAAADLAAGVSHELANALGAIAGWASLARKGGDVNEALNVIESSAESAWAVARQMLGRVSGQNTDPVGVTDASALVRQVGRLLGPRAIESRVRVDVRVTDGLTVAAEHGALWSVVWNLALNAVEAMESGGELLLQLSARHHQVVLVVADTGPGMGEELQATVFEPYVTTKATGSGIGLATVRRVVQSMGGTITLQSTVGKGTRFEVCVDRAAAPAASSERDRAIATSSTSQPRSSGVFLAKPLEGRVLVVDDDTGVREMAATALSIRGAEVVAVASAREALQTTGVFDVALIDMLLGDTTGDIVLKSLRAEGRVKRGLLVTGVEPSQLRAVPGGEPDAVLRKPFRLDDLFDLVGELLDGQPDHQSHSSR